MYVEILFTTACEFWELSRIAFGLFTYDERKQPDELFHRTRYSLEEIKASGSERNNGLMLESKRDRSKDGDDSGFDQSRKDKDGFTTEDQTVPEQSKSRSGPPQQEAGESHQESVDETDISTSCQKRHYLKHLAISNRDNNDHRDTFPFLKNVVNENRKLRQEVDQLSRTVNVLEERQIKLSMKLMERVPCPRQTLASDAAITNALHATQMEDSNMPEGLLSEPAEDRDSSQFERAILDTSGPHRHDGGLSNIQTTTHGKARLTPPTDVNNTATGARSNESSRCIYQETRQQVPEINIQCDNSLPTTSLPHLLTIQTEYLEENLDYNWDITHGNLLEPEDDAFDILKLKCISDFEPQSNMPSIMADPFTSIMKLISDIRYDELPCTEETTQKKSFHVERDNTKTFKRNEGNILFCNTDDGLDIVDVKDQKLLKTLLKNEDLNPKESIFIHSSGYSGYPKQSIASEDPIQSLATIDSNDVWTVNEDDHVTWRETKVPCESSFHFDVDDSIDYESHCSCLNVSVEYEGVKYEKEQYEFLYHLGVVYTHLLSVFYCTEVWVTSFITKIEVKYPVGLVEEQQLESICFACEWSRHYNDGDELLRIDSGFESYVKISVNSLKPNEFKFDDKAPVATDSFEIHKHSSYQSCSFDSEIISYKHMPIEFDLLYPCSSESEQIENLALHQDSKPELADTSSISPFSGHTKLERADLDGVDKRNSVLEGLDDVVAENVKDSDDGCKYQESNVNNCLAVVQFCENVSEDEIERKENVKEQYEFLYHLGVVYTHFLSVFYCTEVWVTSFITKREVKYPVDLTEEQQHESECVAGEWSGHYKDGDESLRIDSGFESYGKLSMDSCKPNDFKFDDTAHVATDSFKIHKNSSYQSYGFHSGISSYKQVPVECDLHSLISPDSEQIAKRALQPSSRPEQSDTHSNTPLISPSQNAPWTHFYRGLGFNDVPVAFCLAKSEFQKSEVIYGQSHVGAAGGDGHQHSKTMDILDRVSSLPITTTCCPIISMKLTGKYSYFNLSFRDEVAFAHEKLIRNVAKDAEAIMKADTEITDDEGYETASQGQHDYGKDSVIESILEPNAPLIGHTQAYDAHMDKNINEDMSDCLILLKEESSERSDQEKTNLLDTCENNVDENMTEKEQVDLVIVELEEDDSRDDRTHEVEQDLSQKQPEDPAKQQSKTIDTYPSDRVSSTTSSCCPVISSRKLLSLNLSFRDEFVLAHEKLFRHKPNDVEDISKTDSELTDHEEYAAASEGLHECMKGSDITRTLEHDTPLIGHTQVCEAPMNKNDDEISLDCLILLKEVPHNKTYAKGKNRQISRLEKQNTVLLDACENNVKKMRTQREIEMVEEAVENYHRKNTTHEVVQGLSENHVEKLAEDEDLGMTSVKLDHTESPGLTKGNNEISGVTDYVSKINNEEEIDYKDDFHIKKLFDYFIVEGKTAGIHTRKIPKIKHVCEFHEEKVLSTPTTTPLCPIESLRPTGTDSFCNLNFQCDMVFSLEKLFAKELHHADGIIKTGNGIIDYEGYEVTSQTQNTFLKDSTIERVLHHEKQFIKQTQAYEDFIDKNEDEHRAKFLTLPQEEPYDLSFSKCKVPSQHLIDRLDQDNAVFVECISEKDVDSKLTEQEQEIIEDETEDYSMDNKAHEVEQNFNQYQSENLADEDVGMTSVQSGHTEPPDLTMDNSGVTDSVYEDIDSTGDFYINMMFEDFHVNVETVRIHTNEIPTNKQDCEIYQENELQEDDLVGQYLAEDVSHQMDPTQTISRIRKRIRRKRKKKTYVKNYRHYNKGCSLSSDNEADRVKLDVEMEGYVDLPKLSSQTSQQAENLPSKCKALTKRKRKEIDQFCRKCHRNNFKNNAMCTLDCHVIAFCNTCTHNAAESRPEMNEYNVEITKSINSEFASIESFESDVISEIGRNKGKKVDNIHRRLSPNCPLLKENEELSDDSRTTQQDNATAVNDRQAPVTTGNRETASVGNVTSFLVDTHICCRVPDTEGYQSQPADSGNSQFALATPDISGSYRETGVLSNVRTTTYGNKRFNLPTDVNNTGTGARLNETGNSSVNEEKTVLWILDQDEIHQLKNDTANSQHEITQFVRNTAENDFKMKRRTVRQKEMRKKKQQRANYCRGELTDLIESDEYLSYIYVTNSLEIANQSNQSLDLISTLRLSILNGIDHGIEDGELAQKELRRQNEKKEEYILKNINSLLEDFNSPEFIRNLKSLRYFRPEATFLTVFPGQYGLQEYFQQLANGPVSRVESMRVELVRLSSLSAYTGNGSAVNLARHGFYHDPEHGPFATRCYACQVLFTTWEYFDDVLGMHRRLSPNCPHVRETDSQAENRSTEVQEDERAEPETRGETAGASNSGVPRQTQASFSGITNALRDTPIVESNVVQNLPNPRLQDFVKISSKVTFAKLSYEKHFDIDPRQIEISNPHHAAFAAMQARAESFKGSHWHSNSKQTPLRMAEAGLFFTGNDNAADSSTCFACGVILMYWEKDDNPVYEHAKWRPTCEYILKLKGQTYVEDVVRREQEIQKQLQKENRELSEDNARLSEEITTLKQKIRCKVCLDKDVDVMFLPCNHCACCDTCSPFLTKCPICRKGIGERKKVFI